MIRLRLLLPLLALGLPAIATATDPAPSSNAAAYKAVDIDEYAARHRPLKNGTRTLLPPQYIMFSARIDRPPRVAKTDYLKVAIAVMGITDAPPISHQMLLATPAGLRLPVYVEDVLVPGLTSAAPTKPEGQFHGYHIYTYSKGPAIVVSGFLPK